jgi:RimJ/RimL family protein N-acetyltransferase
LIDKAYRRKGYATTCARKVIECGFAKLSIDRIDGQCHKDNIGSKRVIEKIGMRNTVSEDDGSFHRYVAIEEYYREVLE